jgi:hypothetical protein
MQRMKTRSSVLYTLLTISSLLICASSDAAWYEDVKFSCDDPLRLRGIAMSWLAPDLPITHTAVSQDRGYAVLPMHKFLDAGQGKGAVWSTAALDAKRAEQLRAAVAGSKHDVPIPVEVGSGWFVSYLLKTPGAIILESAMAVMNSLAPKKMPANVFEYLVTDGGVLVKVIEAGLNVKKQPFVAERVLYTVSLGKETRTLTVSVCVYPARVDIERIQSLGAKNNLALIAKGDKRWAVVNLDEPKEMPYQEYERDGEFISIARVNGGINDKFRISMWGGPWQIRQDDKWATLYAKTQAR